MAVLTMVAVISLALLWRLETTRSAQPPQPPAGAAAASAPAVDAEARGAGPPGAESRTSAPSSSVLPRSVPVRLAIPEIGVDSAIQQVGVQDDGTVGVPPVDQPELTGWYRNGPSPGEPGPAVILGHVTAPEPAVFFELGALRPGDTVEVTRADGTVAVFEVDAVRSVRKDSFPADDVYGPLDHAGLRLVTCGGPYDRDIGEYLDNVIVYASLSSWHEA